MISFNDFSLLSGKVQKPLLAIREKLEKDYLTFFENVANQYKGTRATKETKLISDTISMIRSAIKEIEIVSETSDESVVKIKTDKILSLLNDIKSSAQWFSKSENISKKMQDRLEQASLDTNTTIGDIKKTSRVISARTQKVLKAPSKFASAFGAFQKTETSQQLGAGISNMFGPFSGIAKLIGGEAKSFSSKQESLSKKAFTGSTIAGGEREPEAFENMNEYLWGRENIPGSRAREEKIGGKDKSSRGKENGWKQAYEKVKETFSSASKSSSTSS